MKDWYKRSKNITLRDGTEVKEYTLVFNTTETALAKEVERYFQEILDRDKELGGNE